MKHLFALVLTAALAPATLISGDLTRTPILPEGLGVEVYLTDPRPGEMKMLAEGGFRWVRMDLHWHTTELEKGKYDFAAYDRLLAALETHRIRPLLILDYSNKLYDDGQSPRSEEGRQAFARWAVAAAERYKGRGIVWEMYNEPNARGFWTPEVNVQDYIKLALAVGKAFRAGAPGEVMVGPAVAGTDSWFLEECFKAGLLEYWSGVTVHPYRSTDPETVAQRYRSFRRLIAKYAPKGKPMPILSGEWGYAVGASGVSEEKQGKFLPRQWLINIANNVPLSIWFTWHDDRPDPQGKGPNWGVVRYPYYPGRDPVYDPKPSYLAAKTLTTALNGFSFTKRLAAGGASDYVLLFSRGNDVRLAAWTTWPAPSKVVIPSGPGRFRVTAHTGERLLPVVAGTGGVAITLSDAPQYLAPEGPNEPLRLAAAWETLPREIPRAASSDLQRKFEQPPIDCKPMVRWWWFGPAVTNKEIEREIRFMEDGGFGGFQLDTVYPMTVDDPAKGLVNFSYLSKEHLDAVGFAANIARQHGMRMDVQLGSGWPYGGPHIPVEQAAGRLRIHRVEIGPETTRVPLPQLKPGERFITAFIAPGNRQSFSPSELREASDVRNGELQVPAASHPRLVVFFSAGRTFMMVKRPAVGAEGYVLDHFNRDALENHLATVGEKLLQAAGPGSVHSVYCDSLEVIGSDWAADTLQEFHRRRGYDLKPYLPALVADIGEKTAAVRHDYGRTLSELFTERFLQPLHEWSRRHNVLLRLQPYGMPAAGESSLAHVDLPEGEAPSWGQFSYLRWASSASHVYGRPVTSSETWTWAHPPMFRATPLDLKAIADLHFLEGINQLIAHGWPYSPPEAGKPGWTFYASLALNRNNPWWPVTADLTSYLARVSFMLRQGQPASDVALYAPTDDAWALAHSIWVEQKPLEIGLPAYIGARLGSVIVPRLLEAGYNFDLVDDTAINQIGHRYRVILLPGIERIPPATLSKLAEFARQGGILVAAGRLPTEAPGLMHRDEQVARIAKLVHELFQGPAARGHFVRDEQETGRRLAALYPPDVIFSPVTPSVGFVHRTASEGEIYFLANTSNARQTLEASFRVEGRSPHWWDPFTGKVTPSEVRPKGDRSLISLDLEPHGSRILVFGKDHGTATPQRTGRRPPVDLSRGWQVVFEGGKQVFMDQLRSWTDDEDSKFFSGQASYYKRFAVPVELLENGLYVKLYFGEPVPVRVTPEEGLRAGVEGPVREAAEVYVNGARAGSVWHPPYEIDVTGLLRPGVNELRVVVANLLINQMANSPRPGGATLAERLSFYKDLNARYGVRFHPEDLRNLEPLPSGLLGPVRLVAGDSAP